MAEIVPETVICVDQAVEHDESTAYQESSGDDSIPANDLMFLLIKNTTGASVTQRIEVGLRKSIAASGTRGITLQPMDVVVPANSTMRTPLLEIYAQADGTFNITGTGAGVFYLPFRLARHF